MLLLLSSGFGMLELGEDERGALFEFGVGAGTDLEPWEPLVGGATGCDLSPSLPGCGEAASGPLAPWASRSGTSSSPEIWTRCVLANLISLLSSGVSTGALRQVDERPVGVMW